MGSPINRTNRACVQSLLHDVHPIMVVGDYYLATFLNQETWIEDIRPFRAVMMALDLPQQTSDIERFIPAGATGSPMMDNARQRYTFDMHSSLVW